jgi:hypothetical protein
MDEDTVIVRRRSSSRARNKKSPGGEDLVGSRMVACVDTRYGIKC